MPKTSFFSPSPKKPNPEKNRGVMVTRPLNFSKPDKGTNVKRDNCDTMLKGGQLHEELFIDPRSTAEKPRLEPIDAPTSSVHSR